MVSHSPGCRRRKWSTSSRTGCSDLCNPTGYDRCWTITASPGAPPAPATEIAARHRVTGATVSNQVRTVRAAGPRLPLTTALITAATRRSEPADDHLGRVRIADTLGLPRPAPPEPATPPIPRVPQSASSAGPQVTWAAARVLAAAGPLDLDTLLQAVDRSRRFRDRTPIAGNGSRRRSHHHGRVHGTRRSLDGATRGGRPGPVPGDRRRGRRP